MTIRLLTSAEFPRYQPALLELLRDAVDAEASVGFLPPLLAAEGRAFWQEIGAAVAAGTTLVLVAEETGEVVGTVQLHLATKPNGRHRAEVAKLLVPTRAQRRGIGRQLMGAVEELARQHGRTTLVLDTLQGAASERLYQGLSYLAVGPIPEFCQVPGGALAATVVYYKLLA